MRDDQREALAQLGLTEQQVEAVRILLDVGSDSESDFDDTSGGSIEIGPTGEVRRVSRPIPRTRSGRLTKHQFDRRTKHTDNKTKHTDNKTKHTDNKTKHTDNKTKHTDNKTKHTDNKTKLLQALDDLLGDSDTLSSRNVTVHLGRGFLVFPISLDETDD
jgi:hypothetical protein